MIYNETCLLLSRIEGKFLNFNPKNKEKTAVEWSDSLKNISLEDAFKALTIYVEQGHEFAPSNPGQLIAIIRKYKPTENDKYKLLEDIKYALRNATYGSEEEFSKLPRAAQMAVGSPNELRRISHNGLSNYVENNLIKRIEESIDIIEARNEQSSIPQLNQLCMDYQGCIESSEI